MGAIYWVSRHSGVDENRRRQLTVSQRIMPILGHCHPKVVRAGSLQMATISTNNRFLHDELVQCAKSLTAKMPSPLSVCFFVNSGSEANDLALRLARNYTKRQDVITLDHAYHGHLTSVMEISPYKFNQPGGDPKPDYVHVAPSPDVYRGTYTNKHFTEAELTKLYVKPITDIIEKSQHKSVAAFIAESLQSCGGQVIPPEGYFAAAYEAVRKAGGVCIADEVQVGFGRVGTHYWAFETQGVVPDIVTVAKPMGNGHPVGAVVTTPEIADAFYATGVAYFNTYGGNPVSCAIANAVMRVIDEEGLQENARKVGDYLLKKCCDLRHKHEIMGDVRGMGLFIGIELVKDRCTREPDTKSAHWVVNRMKQFHKILVSSDGPNENVIKLKPPMCFNQENADEFLRAFHECLTMLAKVGNDAVVTAVGSKHAIANTSTNSIFERSSQLIKSI